jgi:hypothetical protein
VVLHLTTSTALARVHDGVTHAHNCRRRSRRVLSKLMTGGSGGGGGGEGTIVNGDTEADVVDHFANMRNLQKKLVWIFDCSV